MTNPHQSGELISDDSWHGSTTHRGDLPRLAAGAGPQSQAYGAAACCWATFPTARWNNPGAPRARQSQEQMGARRSLRPKKIVLRYSNLSLARRRLQRRNRERQRKEAASAGAGIKNMPALASRRTSSGAMDEKKREEEKKPPPGFQMAIALGYGAAERIHSGVLWPAGDFAHSWSSAYTPAEPYVPDPYTQSIYALFRSNLGNGKLGDYACPNDHLSPEAATNGPVPVPCETKQTTLIDSG